MSAWPEDIAGPWLPSRRDWKSSALPMTLLDTGRAAKADGPGRGHGCSAVTSGPEGAGPLHLSGRPWPGGHSRPRGQAERDSEDAEERPEPGRGPWGCAVPSPTGLSWSREWEPAVEEAPRGGGLSQGPGALLLKVNVKVSRTQPHPAEAKAAGAGRRRGHWGGAPGETGGWPQPACSGDPEHRNQGLCRQKPHGRPPLPGKGSR